MVARPRQYQGEVPAEVRPENIRAAIYGLGEHALAPIELPSHVRMLGTLAREEETDHRVVERRPPRRDTVLIALREDRDRLRDIRSDDGAAPGKRSAADLKRPGGVRQIRLRMLLEVLGEILGRALECSLRTGREQQKLERPCGSRRTLRRWLLEYDVSVCPTYAEGAHTGTSG